MAVESDPGGPAGMIEGVTKIVSALTTLAAGVGLFFEQISKLFPKPKPKEGEEKEPKDSAEAIVQQPDNRLNKAERQKVLRTLTTRLWVARGLGIALLLLGATSLAGWWLVSPTARSPSSLKLKDVGPITADKDEWFLFNRLLGALVVQLKGEAGSDPKQRIISARTPPFGEFTDGHPITKTSVKLTYSASQFTFTPPYVLIHHTQTDSFGVLPVQSADGTVGFTIPPSSDKDWLLIVGVLTARSEKVLPAKYDQLLTVETTK